MHEGKRMIGWDEVLHPSLPRETAIQSWRRQKSLADAARQGYSGILSFGYYLDYILTTAQHYAVDPVPDSLGLDAEQASRILGGEACMWTEYVSPLTIDTRLWPRLAAIAERFWSPKQVTDVDDMYRRLDAIGPEFALPFQLVWAATPALAKVAPLVAQLQTLGGMGREALVAIVANHLPRPGWTADALAAVTAAGAPHGQVEFAMLPAVRLLVVAADERARLDPRSTPEWVVAVRARARALAPKASPES
jgi:hypothetical protein